MRKLSSLEVGLAALGLLAGCTPNISSDSYNTTDTQHVSQVRHGVIVSISKVKVSGADSKAGNWAGTLAGGAAGGVAGSAVGQGTGSALMAIGGALLGGIAGNKAQEAMTTQDATQYIVKLQNGNTVSVTQGGTVLAVGTKVLLLEGDPARLIVDTTSSN